MFEKENALHYSYLGNEPFSHIHYIDLLKMRPIRDDDEPNKKGGNKFWLSFSVNYGGHNTDGCLAIGCKGSYIIWNNVKYETEDDFKKLYLEIQKRNVESVFDVLG